MTANVLPEFVMLGPSKTGSSWRHRALEEHPEVHLPKLKPVNYFNVKYHLGGDWYRSVFREADPDEVVGDSSPPYFVNEQAPARISETLGDVKLLTTLRNPIDRAFSHWWHDTAPSQKLINCDFEDLLFVDQMYEVYIRMGMYATHLERWQEEFGPDQIHVTLFEDFAEDNLAFIQDIYEFIGVDPTYEPSVAGKQVNTAESGSPELYQDTVRWFVNDAPNWLRRAVSPAYPLMSYLFETEESAYDQGMDPDFRKELELLYAEPSRRLSELIDRDLDHWFDHIDLDGPEYRTQVEFTEEYKRHYRHWESRDVVQKKWGRSVGRVDTTR